MEKSQSYHRRKELLGKLEVPTMSEVTKKLGKPLAKVVFGECPDALKENIGLEPRLKGAGASLWTSPSDLMIGTVRLKPPLTDKHTKALTHEGIVEIGNAIERRFWIEMETERKKSLAAQEEYLKNISEQERRIAVKMTRDEEKSICQAYCDQLNVEFETNLKNQLENLTRQIIEDEKKVLDIEITVVEDEWQVKLQNAVQATINNLTEQFLDDLEKQKKDLEATFTREFERQRTEFEYAIKQESDFGKTTLKQLRHCLECKNLANLMYVLCMERRKCDIERSLLEFKHKTKIEELNRTIQARENDLNALAADRDHKQHQLDIREKCVVEILKQFQKFINYALRATPAQAEFLLNVKKMMLFEITQAMVKGNQTKAKHLARTILPWKSDSETSSISEKKSKLEPVDYHDCLHEVAPPKGSDFVPAFYYNDKMYVNEDLRLMVAKGMEMSETNLLWNKDVENMIKILKSSVGRDTHDEGTIKTLSSSEVASEELISSHYIESAKLEVDKPEKPGSKEKSVLKNSEDVISNPILYCNISGGQEAVKSESKGTTEFLKKIIKASWEAEIAAIDNVGLLAARDSLVKIRESRIGSLREIPTLPVDETETGERLQAVKETLETKIQPEDKSNPTEGSVNFENFDVITIPDQLEIKKTIKSSKASIKKSQAGVPYESILVSPSPKRNMSKESKLLSVVDSIIIHRNSIVPPVPGRKSISHPIEECPSCAHSSSGRASIVSRLSEAKDSLELIRKQSSISRSKMSGGNLLASGSQVKIAASDESEDYRLSTEKPPRPTSYIELVKIPTVETETTVYFSPIKEVYEANVLQTSDSPWKIYEPQVKETSRDNFLTKPNELQLCGDRKSKEHLHGSVSFTVNRINSIMDILKDDSSLMRLFTSCTK